ncbi:PREDICTED: homocysteine S-methyltransferase YbgG-like [Dinoponera quadriceps]|uniref:Homocysteine S-methyltransferase YbgG-like n=1 Tax=Dinoponera quadriceps TaxID=609295 RepID=A0A6P3WXK2_DINQU|nr:PREDICTED: homocysteine S-methyltransferase YbgG-like [Dinoponera quadriceps]
MHNRIVIDGDFKTQLRCHLSVNEMLRPMFELQALKYNRYAVYKTHLDYLRAGAKIIKTNTDRASEDSVKEYLNVGELQASSIIGAAVQTAKKAVHRYYEETHGKISNVKEFERRRPLVAGSCSNYSVVRFTSDVPIEYWNFTPRDVIVRWYGLHVKTLLSNGVDLLAFESIPCLTEAKAIITVLKMFPKARAWITFDCPVDAKLLDGSDFISLALQCYDFLSAQIIAIGMNRPMPASMVPLLRSINDNRDSKIPFMFHVDNRYLSGIENAAASGKAPQRNFAQEWLDVGVRYISGGGKTNAEDVKTVCEYVREYRSSRKGNWQRK